MNKNRLIRLGSAVRVKIGLSFFLLLISSPLWASLEPPVPSVNGMGIYWNPVDAITINVHTGNGTWIESITGSSTQWLAPSPGEYFLVSADHGNWRDWGRSITVSVGTGEDQTQVRNLRASVYDAHSAEIFWEPPITFGVVASEYRVFRNGELVKTCDCRSHYDNGLRANANYEYTVLPVNLSGIEGSSTSVTVTIPLAGGIGAPENLTSQAYSSTALELFWDRNPNIARFKVYRDGTQVADTDGISFFDSNLQSGSSYVYEVRSFDAFDVQGGAANTTVTTLGSDARPPLYSILSLSNYSSIVGHVFDVYSGRTSRKVILRGWQFLNETMPDTRTDSEELYAYTENYVCLNGGTVIVESRQSGIGTQTLVAEYDNCLWQSEFLNGKMTFDPMDSNNFAKGGQFEFEDFSEMTLNTDVTSFDGQVIYTFEQEPGGGERRTWTNRLERLDARIGRNIGPIEWRNIDTTFFSCDDCRGAPANFGLAGSAKIRSRGTNRNTLTVNTPVAFTTDASSSSMLTIGQLDIRAEDTSRIVLDAGNGVDTDVTVLIYDMNGVAGTEFMVPWDTWKDNLMF